MDMIDLSINELAEMVGMKDQEVQAFNPYF